MRPRPDRIVALTTPPYLSIVARLVSKFRGADHAHWVMDLYPDVMVAHGMLKERSLLRRFLAALARWGFGGKRCAAMVTLGPDMAQAVDAYLPAEQKSAWVPLWATGGRPSIGGGQDGLGGEDQKVEALRRNRGWREDDTVFLYSGNMGLGHRFGEFLEVVRIAGNGRISVGGGEGNSKLRFVFSGRGKRRGEIEAFLADRNSEGGEAIGSFSVELMDYVPAEDLIPHLLSGDVHLASMEPSWDGTMVPSKLQGSFSVGRPVLFVGSRTCSIGKWILDSGGGWVVAPHDLSGLQAAVLEGCDVAERTRRGALAVQFAREHFDVELNAARVAGLLIGR
jgi:glycosyltransferase involved in cell wall biosynthesis